MLRRPPTRMELRKEAGMEEYEKEKKQRDKDTRKGSSQTETQRTREQRIGLQK